MYRSSFAAKADEYAVLAAGARSPDERALYLSLEKSFREFAEADRRIVRTRDRHPSLFARRPYGARTPERV